MSTLWQTWYTFGDKVLMIQQSYRIPNVLPFTLTGAIKHEYTKNGRTGKLYLRHEETKTRICPFILGQAVRNRTASGK